MYGLLDYDIEYILKAMNQFKEIDTAILFGSRAMGNYKKGSDIDIAVCGEKITDSVILRLNDLLNEVYPLPYFFDVLHYEEISNPNLIQHIDSEGKILYIRAGLGSMPRRADHIGVDNLTE